MNENNSSGSGQSALSVSNINGQPYLALANMDGFVSTQSLIYNGGATGISYTFQQDTNINNGKVKRISPKLYFSYVKSKLNKTQTKKLKSRLQKLQTLVKNADENGQNALYEEFSRMLVVAVREAASVACGYDVYVNRTDISKFMGLVTENNESSRNPIRFKKLEEFTRPVPDNVGKIIKSVRAKGLFDELHVLYLDYTEENIKSTKEKIREKDPVLFGKFSYDNERYFFITDWIDEHCDLTLTKFVDKLKEDDKEYETKKIEDITSEYLERIKQEMKEREERLKNTNPSNFGNNITEEEKRATERAKWREEASKELEGQENLIDPLPKPKKPWYRSLF